MTSPCPHCRGTGEIEDFSGFVVTVMAFAFVWFPAYYVGGQRIRPEARAVHFEGDYRDPTIGACWMELPRDWAPETWEDPYEGSIE